MTYDEMKQTAEDHVNWFLCAIKPLLIDNFVHGMKHGLAISEMKNRDLKINDKWAVGNELRKSVKEAEGAEGRM